jgi:hypothetical protein
VEERRGVATGALHFSQRLERAGVGGLGADGGLEVVQRRVRVAAGLGHLGRVAQQPCSARTATGLRGTKKKGEELLHPARLPEPGGRAVHHRRVGGAQLRQGKQCLQCLGGSRKQRCRAAVERFGLVGPSTAGEEKGGAEGAWAVLPTGVHLGEQRERLTPALPLAVQGHHLFQRLGRVGERARGERGVAEPEFEAEALGRAEGVHPGSQRTPVIGLGANRPRRFGR